MSNTMFDAREALIPGSVYDRVNAQNGGVYLFIILLGMLCDITIYTVMPCIWPANSLVWYFGLVVLLVKVALLWCRSQVQPRQLYPSRPAGLYWNRQDVCRHEPACTSGHVYAPGAPALCPHAESHGPRCRPWWPWGQAEATQIQQPGDQPVHTKLHYQPVKPGMSP